VVVVGDAVATTTANGDAALTVMGGTSSLVVLTTVDIVDYLQSDAFCLGRTR